MISEIYILFFKVSLTIRHTATVSQKLEDLKVLKGSPDLLNNVKIGQGQIWLIIQTYFVLPYMGSGHFDQVTQK